MTLQASLPEPLNGSKMSFVHLHVHSHYSLLQASCVIQDLVNQCVQFNQPAMALTDYGNMFGILEFYFEALKKNINPILGCEFYYVDDNTKKESHYNFRDPSRSYKTLILLAQDLEAYKNLCCIVTEANQKGFYFLPRADYDLFERHKKGLIALTAGGRGRTPWMFYNKGKDRAVQEIQTLHKIFGGNLYLQLQNPFIKRSGDYNSFLAEISKQKSLPLVMGWDVHYVKKSEALTQDVLSCIGTNRTLYDKERFKLEPNEFYFKSSEEVRKSSASDFYQQACDSTLEIAGRCKVRFKIKDSKGPIYHLPRIARSGEHLKSLVYKGLEKRLQEAVLRGEDVSDQKRETYRKRIQYELDIIQEMGFNGYFYIVYDFIHWARKNHIPVGPGRGSGASSLVSFCLEITDLDPMPLNLIFERFLNPERISMPDFDIDFCQENRHKVIDYINQKYGSDCSSHVITYGRLNVRAAIRDAGRVLALSYAEVDQIAKLIPDILGITLKEALKKEPRLTQMSEEDPKIKELLDLTALLEGLIRHVGIHAAGIIIADHPIVNYAPLYRGADGENVIQYDLKYAEKIGLIKFDFLGLKTLTHIAETFRLIEKSSGKSISTQQISLNDEGIYEIMSQGDTVGIFQFEGAGITDLLIRSQPTCFEDIVALNALYRPGPMNMIPSYLDRKKAKESVNYIFEDLEPILKETYGIIVYQEQVQQIAVKIAGYSYGEADVLRRAMGKKIRSVMEKQKNRFLEGAKKKGYPLKKSVQLFDLMAEFAKYGFNKSHAAAYCVLAAQTAWLKRYYPIEFLASHMTIEQNDSDKLFKPIRDAKDHGYKVLSPHVNTSFEYFAIQGQSICYSLAAIKGIGLSSAKEIVRARESLKEKKFSSITHFFETVDYKKLNKKTIESLIKAGALDGFGYHRKEISINIEKWMDEAERRARDRQTGQQNLFGGANPIQIEKSPPWSYKDQSNFEKEVLGFYLNEHPLKAFEGLEESLKFKKLSEIKEGVNSSVQALVMIGSLREIFTKKGDKMAFCLLEDNSSRLEAILFPSVYEKAKEAFVKSGEIFYISGKLQKDKNASSQIVINEIFILDDFLKKFQKMKIHLNFDMEKDKLSSLKTLIESAPSGSSQVFFQTYLPEEKAHVEIDTKETYNIEINYDLLQKISDFFTGSKNIQLF